MNDNKLKRNLSFIQMIAISSGAVIGGWLAEAPYWFQTTGAGAAFLFPLLALLLVPVGLAFGELSAMLPFAAGVDAWTSNAYDNKTGFATQWMMFLIQVVEPPMMAFIFGTAINHFHPLDSDQMMMVAMLSVTLWFVLSNFNISLTGKLSNFFFFSMIVISLLVSSSFFLSGHWSMDHIRLNQGFFPKGGYGIFIAMAVFSLKFIGFEMTPTLMEETNFPAAKIWKVILASLFIPALLYSFVVLAMGGMAPWHEIASMSMPEPELVARYGLPVILGILAIVSGLMHAFTTLMGFWTSSARVLYGAAQLNQGEDDGEGDQEHQLRGGILLEQPILKPRARIGAGVGAGGKKHRVGKHENRRNPAEPRTNNRAIYAFDHVFRGDSGRHQNVRLAHAVSRHMLRKLSQASIASFPIMARYRLRVSSWGIPAGVLGNLAPNDHFAEQIQTPEVDARHRRIRRLLAAQLLLGENGNRR